MPDQPAGTAATRAQVQVCDVAGCGHPSVTLLANDASFDSPEYREWYACRWHQRNTSIAADALALPVTSLGSPHGPDTGAEEPSR